jgi:hypothetical protein
LSGLTKEEVLEIMKNYGSLSKKYLKDWGLIGHLTMILVGCPHESLIKKEV